MDRERRSDSVASSVTRSVPFGFFLWGFVKNTVYKAEVSTVEELKAEIRYAFSCVSRDMLRNVLQNFQRRVQACLSNNGGHFECLL